MQNGVKAITLHMEDGSEVKIENEGHTGWFHVTRQTKNNESTARVEACISVPATYDKKAGCTRTPTLKI